MSLAMEEHRGGREGREGKEPEKAVEDGDRRKMMKMCNRSSRKVVSLQDESGFVKPFSSKMLFC